MSASNAHFRPCARIFMRSSAAMPDASSPSPPQADMSASSIATRMPCIFVADFGGGRCMMKLKLRGRYAVWPMIAASAGCRARRRASTSPATASRCQIKRMRRQYHYFGSRIARRICNNAYRKMPSSCDILASEMCAAPWLHAGRATVKPPRAARQCR